MKTAFILLLSFILTVVITAPSIINLINIDKGFVQDCNEEKKEINENDIFFYPLLEHLGTPEYYKPGFIGTYIQDKYLLPLEIFVPPPERIR